MANSQNKFTNDGSFLEQFKKLQEQKQAEKRKDDDSHSVQPTVKHLKPAVGRMGGQKRKLPLKQSAKPVHKAFQDESDSDEDERNTNKKRPEAGGPSKLQSEGQPCAESSYGMPLCGVVHVMSTVGVCVLRCPKWESVS